MKLFRNNTTKLFEAIKHNKSIRAMEILAQKNMVNVTMPLDYIPIAFDWLLQDINYNPEYQPPHIQEAIHNYLTINILEWTIIHKNFDVFSLLLSFGADIKENTFNRAISYANTICDHDENSDDKWLYVLLKYVRRIPFSSIEFSLESGSLNAFNILYENNRNIIYCTNNKIYFNTLFTVGMLGKVHDISRLQFLVREGVKIQSGDIFARLEDTRVNFEILGILMRLFVEEYSVSEVMFDLFDVDNGGKLIPNALMNEAFNRIAYSQYHMSDWFRRINEVIQTTRVHVVDPHLFFLAHIKKKVQNKQLITIDIFLK